MKTVNSHLPKVKTTSNCLPSRDRCYPIKTSSLMRSLELFKLLNMKVKHLIRRSLSKTKWLIDWTMILHAQRWTWSRLTTRWRNLSQTQISAASGSSSLSNLFSLFCLLSDSIHHPIFIFSFRNKNQNFTRL